MYTHFGQTQHTTGALGLNGSTPWTRIQTEFLFRHDHEICRKLSNMPKVVEKCRKLSQSVEKQCSVGRIHRTPAPLRRRKSRRLKPQLGLVIAALWLGLSGLNVSVAGSKSANKLLTEDSGTIEIIQHMKTVCD